MCGDMGRIVGVARGGSMEVDECAQGSGRGSRERDINSPLPFKGSPGINYRYHSPAFGDNR